MYMYALLGESHEFWTYNCIFLMLVIITLSTCFVIFHYYNFFFHSFLCFYHYLLCFISSFHLDWWFLHILVHREGSHITPFIPSLELIQRSWLKRLSHGCEFTCSLVIEFIPCIFPIGVWIIDDQSMHIHSKKRKEKWKKKWK